MLAVLGGSGFYSIGRLVERLDVITPWGIAAVNKVRLFDEEFLFLPRHGPKHEYAPHRINYRANIRALHKLGATAILATYAAGIISKYKVGDLVMPDDFIGLHTPISFFNDFSSGIRHKDISEPFDRGLCTIISGIANAEKIKLKTGGVVATTTGPRFESRAEIRALKGMGAHLVNMTSAYEITLANEMELPFAAVVVGTNYACGISQKPPQHEEAVLQVTKAQGRINTIVSALVEEVY